MEREREKEALKVKRGKNNKRENERRQGKRKT